MHCSRTSIPEGERLVSSAGLRSVGSGRGPGYRPSARPDADGALKHASARDTPRRDSPSGLPDCGEGGRCRCASEARVHASTPSGVPRHSAPGFAPSARLVPHASVVDAEPVTHLQAPGFAPSARPVPMRPRSAFAPRRRSGCLAFRPTPGARARVQVVPLRLSSPAAVGAEDQGSARSGVGAR